VKKEDGMTFHFDMTIYSIHIICKVCGQVLFMSEPLPEDEVDDYSRALITDDEIKIVDIFK
jgi:transcription elongation factor Elf1